jgi:hypothetical protein
MSTKSKNYYDVLEIPVGTPQEEIHSAYLRSKNAYSKDSLALYSLMTKDECEEILVTIDEAYIILSDPSKRIQYDENRGLQSVQTNKDRVENIMAQPNLNSVMPSTANLTNKQNIKKIVSNLKFSLDYNIDERFETEIESCTEFTGELLQKIREYKNVDIVRMSDMTRVSKTYIKNIEAEMIENLPAKVYVRGFVYQYAKCLKLNPDLVANSFMKRISPPSEKVN